MSQICQAKKLRPGQYAWWKFLKRSNDDPELGNLPSTLACIQLPSTSLKGNVFLEVRSFPKDIKPLLSLSSLVAFKTPGLLLIRLSLIAWNSNNTYYYYSVPAAVPGPRAAIGPVIIPSSLHHQQVLWDEARWVRSLPWQVEAWFVNKSLTFPSQQLLRWASTKAIAKRTEKKIQVKHDG